MEIGVLQREIIYEMQILGGTRKHSVLVARVRQVSIGPSYGLQMIQ